MPRDKTQRVSAAEARRLARIALGKGPDDLSDVYRGRPTRPRSARKLAGPPNPYVPAAPLSLAAAAAQLRIRPVQLAQAVREGALRTIRRRGGELLNYLPMAQDVGLHVVVARRVASAGRAIYEPILQRIRELGTSGLLLSGNRQEGALVGQHAPAPQPPGRGLLVRRRRPAVLMQVAWTPPTDR